MCLVLRIIPSCVGAMVATQAGAVPQVLAQGDDVPYYQLNLVFTLRFMLHNCNLRAKNDLSVNSFIS
jgi:hypothetical protein